MRLGLLALALLWPVQSFLRSHTIPNFSGKMFSAREEGGHHTPPYCEMPLTLELRTPLLEESLDFFESNFGLEVLRHEEFVCPDDDSACWSRTLVSPHLALLYLYNTTHYRRGNDLRYLAMRRSSYRGPEDAVIVDDFGAEYVEGPTFWVRLVPSQDAADDSPVGRAYMYASVHVSDRPSSLKAYRSVLGASGGGSSSVKNDSLPSWAGLELVELPQGQVLTPSVAVPFPLISDEDGSESVERLDVATRVVSFAVHGEDSSRVGGAANTNLRWTWTDPDGLVVQQQIFQDNLSPSSKTAVRIDWAYREERQERLRARARARRSSSSTASGSASRLVQLDPSSYSQSIAGCSARGHGIILEMVVPWCPRCVALKPGLEALAACLKEEKEGEGEGDMNNKHGKGRPAAAFFAVDASDRRFGYRHPQDLALQTALAWSQRAGFPSLFFLPPPGPHGEIGDVEVYEGKTSIRGVREWVEERVLGVDAAARASYSRDDLARLEEIIALDERQEISPEDSGAGDSNGGTNDVEQADDGDDDDDDCCVL